MAFKNPEEVMAAVEKALGYRLTERQWDALYVSVEHVVNGADTVPDLVDHILAQKATWAGEGLASPWSENKEHWAPDEVVPRLRVVAVNRLLYEDAKKWEPVRSFRVKYLKSALLKDYDQVHEWLYDQWERDDIVPKPGRTLAYLEAEDDPCEIRHGSGGVMEVLHQLADLLERRYGWEQAESVNFVLSDRPPKLVECVVEVDERWPFLVASRIHMVIDPALSPQQVGQRYLEARNILLPGRYHSLSRKHLALAMESSSTSGSRWKRQMRWWNNSWLVQMNPDWRYSTETNFARDTKAAVRRVLIRISTKDQRARLAAARDGWPDSSAVVLAPFPKTAGD